MADKAAFDEVEHTESSLEKYGGVAKHGDRALAIIGDERVIVTDEDVRWTL